MKYRASAKTDAHRVFWRHAGAMAVTAARMRSIVGVSRSSGVPATAVRCASVGGRSRSYGNGPTEGHRAAEGPRDRHHAEDQPCVVMPTSSNLCTANGKGRFGADNAASPAAERSQPSCRARHDGADDRAPGHEPLPQWSVTTQRREVSPVEDGADVTPDSSAAVGLHGRLAGVFRM